MSVTNENVDFVEYCKRTFILRDPEADDNVEVSSFNDEDDNYFSDGELSVDETSEVSDSYFYSHLHDDEVNEENRKTPPEDEIMLKSPVKLLSYDGEEVTDEEKTKLPANEGIIPEDERKLHAKVNDAFFGDDIIGINDLSYTERQNSVISSSMGLFSIEDGWKQQAQLCRGGRPSDNLLCCLHCDKC